MNASKTKSIEAKNKSRTFRRYSSSAQDAHRRKVRDKIEAILFVAARPLSAQELAKIVDIKKEEIEKNCAVLQGEYREHNAPYCLLEQNGKYELTVRGEYLKYVEKFLKEELIQELTPASLETLAIIAYRGPIQKEEIEYIRGINCSLIVRNLMMRGLIEEQEKDGKLIYTTNLDFLKILGIITLKELPEYEKYNSLEMKNENIKM
ncbi:MAG: SMC-Scp complex subunit ScpB [Parcubacteria group bacterium]|nr:SMC-Scp complex subunit ScpB [Parcubacteria group bacterium]